MASDGELTMDVGVAAEPATPPPQSSSSVEYVIVAAEGHNIHTAIFTVPPGMERQLSSNAVNARGSQFALEVGPQSGQVQTTFYSGDPDATAKAIGVRLAGRVNDPSPPGAEECSVS